MPSDQSSAVHWTVTQMSLHFAVHWTVTRMALHFPCYCATMSCPGARSWPSLCIHLLAGKVQGVCRLAKHKVRAILHLWEAQGLGDVAGQLKVWILMVVLLLVLVVVWWGCGQAPAAAAAIGRHARWCTCSIWSGVGLRLRAVGGRVAGAAGVQPCLDQQL